MKFFRFALPMAALFAASVKVPSFAQDALQPVAVSFQVRHVAPEAVGENFPGADEKPATKATPVVGTPPATVASWHHELDRWLDLSAFNYGNRYRSVFAYDGAHSFSQGQQRLVADGKFKFDSGGKYGIGFHLSSGRYFNWAYADYMGGGQHQFIDNVLAKAPALDRMILGPNSYPPGFFNSGGGQLYFRQFYLAAQPIKGITAQFGGLAIEHGVNTEATSYDDDGYMAGERVTIERPKQLFLSQLSYTRGYIGDLYTPNFFARGERLAISNYWQILGRKDFGKRASASADYTITTPVGWNKLHTIRGAVSANVSESKVFDSVRFEAYRRMDAVPDGHFTFGAGKGYALTVSRSFARRFSIEAGVANIDPNYFVYVGNNAPASVLGLAVNGDQYGQGKRYFVRPTVPLNHFLSLTGSFSHIYAYTPPDGIEVIWNSQSLTAGMVVDVKRLLFPESAH